jgi:DNA-binding GntR family transcriptional regulator
MMPAADPLDQETAEAAGLNPADRPSGPPAYRSNALHIYESMRQRIATRTYPPGAWLKEQEIAVEFSVSRTPVRQALQHLETEGLVEIRNGVGIRVTEVDDDALDQIYLLRLELVSMIGRAAPKPISAADLQALHDVANRLRHVLDAQERPDVAEFARLCELFHNLVNTVIGSPMLKHFIEVLYHQADRYWYGWMEQTDPRREVEFLAHEVNETIRALEANDFEAVGYVRRNHISMMLARMADFRRRQKSAVEGGR